MGTRRERICAHVQHGDRGEIANDRLSGGGDPELLRGCLSDVPGVPGVPTFKKRRERFKQKK
jgi:hypothetical protein